MIEINNLTTVRINKKFLKEITQKVLKERLSFAKVSEGKEKKELDLSIALVCAARIKNLNQKYRKKNRPTDVLSFEDINEIIICPEVVKENAKKFHSTFKKELVRVLIHGILHILGYDHEKGGKDVKIMEEKQNYYLKKIIK